MMRAGRPAKGPPAWLNFKKCNEPEMMKLILGSDRHSSFLESLTNDLSS